MWVHRNFLLIYDINKSLQLVIWNVVYFKLFYFFEEEHQESSDSYCVFYDKKLPDLETLFM